MSTPSVWFITGCSSGFGKDLALEALGRGEKVIATARNASTIDDLKQAGADTMRLDVTSSLDEIKEIANSAHALYGRIDYLVNNAGYGFQSTLEEAR